MNTIDNTLPHLSYMGYQNIGQEKEPRWFYPFLFIAGAIIALGFVM